MEARKRKMETGRIGVWGGKTTGESKKNRGRMRDGMLENAHASGRGFTAKVSRGNQQNVRSTSEQTNPSIDRSGTGGSFPSPHFFTLSLSRQVPLGGTVLLSGSLKLQLERRTQGVVDSVVL